MKLDFQKFTPANAFCCAFWQAKGESGMFYRIALAGGGHYLYEFTRTEVNGITPIGMTQIYKSRELKDCKKAAETREKQLKQKRERLEQARLPYKD